MEIRSEAKLPFKQAQRKAVNMLSPVCPCCARIPRPHSHEHMLQEAVEWLGREKDTWWITMNAQNGKTGAAGRQVSGLRGGGAAGVQGDVAECLMRPSAATAWGVTKVGRTGVRLIIATLSVWVDSCVSVFPIFILLAGIVGITHGNRADKKY